MLTRALTVVAFAASIAGCAPVTRALPVQAVPSDDAVPAGHRKCTWKIVQTDRRVRDGGILNGIAAINSKSAWTVGAHGAGLSLIEHWNGSKWKLSPSLDPSTSLNVLYNVSGSSPSDVWAVGEYSSDTGTLQPLIEHWNGSKWMLSKSPAVGGSYGGHFSNVVALAKNDAWAVGEVNTATSARQMLAEHWNGKRWSVLSTPKLTSNDNYLLAVASRGTNDVWAGGGYNNGTAGSSLGFTMHWDGRKWSTVKIDPLKTLYDPIESLVSVPGGSSLFAVGTYEDEKRKRYAEFAEQLGKGWSQLNPIASSYYYYSTDSTVISGAAAASSTEAFGVGYYTAGSAQRTFAMVWDGHRWQVTLTPNVTGYNSFLNAASVIPGTMNVWAAGGFSLSSKTGPLIEHGQCM